jgi:DNA (cytosine-5)-methyltransferase 1
VDVLAGGFPCQPVSHAGRRLAQDDERWLWPEVARLVRLLRPRAVLLENVPGLLTAGFGDVISDLAACGYDAEWDCIPAAAVGAPHRRDRIFVVAYPMCEGLPAHWEPAPHLLTASHDQHASENGSRSGARDQADVAHAMRWGRQGQGQPQHASNPAQSAEGQAVEPVNGRKRCEWEPEPAVGRVANGVPKRVDRLRSLGNAVVPQVAEVVGRRLMEVVVK